MRPFLVLGLVAVLCSFAAPAFADDVSADVLQAESLSTDGKFAEALQLLNHYLSEHPQDARALVDRGDIYQTQGKTRESIADYSAALAVNPEYAYALASRGDSYVQIEDYPHAIADASKALELRPNYGYALRVRGMARLDTHDVTGAQTDLHQAIKVDSNSAYSYADACRADREAKQPDLALKECATALQIEPENYVALFWQGRLQIDASNWSDAESTYTKVLKIEDNDDAASNYWRAVARYEMHHGDDALSDINTYMKAYPDDGDGFYLRAQIDQLRGDLVAAKKDANSALEHYGIDDDTAGMTRARALLDQLNGAKS